MALREDVPRKIKFFNFKWHCPDRLIPPGNGLSGPFFWTSKLTFKSVYYRFEFQSIMIMKIMIMMTIMVIILIIMVKKMTKKHICSVKYTPSWALSFGKMFIFLGRFSLLVQFKKHFLCVVLNVRREYWQGWGVEPFCTRQPVNGEGAPRQLCAMH